MDNKIEEYGSAIDLCEETPMGRPRKNPVQTDDQGREYFDAIVIAQGTTGRIYPPKDWIGKPVRVIRMG